MISAVRQSIETQEQQEQGSVAYYALSIEEPDREIPTEVELEGGEAALEMLRQTDPDSYRMVLFGWA